MSRQLQGVVFQKARIALVNKILEWGGAAKAGEEFCVFRMLFRYLEYILSRKIDSHAT